MTRYTLNFRTLTLANNTAMSLSNHASPDSMDDVLAQNGGSVIFKDADKSFEMQGNATNSVAQMRRTTGFPAASSAFEGEMNPRPHPSGVIRVAELRSTDSGSVCARLNIKTDGRLELLNAANALLWTSTNPVPTDVPWRWRLARGKGTTTTNGTLIAAVYHGSDGKNTTADSSYSASNVNAGTTDLTGVRLGYTSATAVASPPGLPLSWRNVQIETNSTAVIGPLTEPSNPPEPVLSKGIKMEFDLSGSLNTDSLASVEQLSGPAVTIVPDLVGKKYHFYDTLGRTQPVTIRAVLQKAGSSNVNHDVTVPPLVKRIGPLYRVGGAIR